MDKLNQAIEETVNRAVNGQNPPLPGTLAAQEQNWTETRWQWAEVPARYRGFRLATSPLLALARRLNDDNHSRSWFLWGGYGVGKTGLAVGYARRYVESTGGNVLFRTLPDMLSEMRGTYNRREDEDGPTEAKLLKRYRTVGLLILDDLGAEQVRNSAWLEDRLYQVIGARHSEEKPTVFTSNLSLAELAPRIGERVTWRIVEMAGEDHIIEVTGRNLRA